MRISSWAGYSEILLVYLTETFCLCHTWAMELQYLKYFSSVAETLNFSEAARRCRVSQPSLSAQIKILEDRLGTQLFHRNRRTVTLTREGQALVPRVRRILLDLEGLSTSAKQMQDPLAGNLVVGATPMIELSGMIERLTTMVKEHPKLKLSFLEDGSDPLIDGLLAGQLDLIFVPHSGRLDASLVQYIVVEEMEVAVCSPASSKRSGADDLPFLQVKPGCGIREFMADAAKALGRDPTSSLQASHISMIKKWIQLRLGWSVLPLKCMNSDDKKLIRVERNPKLKPIRLCAAMLQGRRAEEVLKNFEA